MKMSIFGMLFILIVLTVGPLIYFNGGSDYLDKFLQKPSKPSLKLNKDVVYAPVTTDEKVKVYKWKDENGVWQFGSNPPPGLVGVESMTLQPNVNIMKPIDLPQSKEEKQRSGLVRLGTAPDALKSKGDKDKDKEAFGISQDALENPYAPDSISELLNTTKNLQGVLNNRSEAQKSVGK